MEVFPELSEKGNQDALHLVERFKAKLQKCADETISDLYCHLLPHIETDAWTNYRGQLQSVLQNKYVTAETATSEDAWAKLIREAIFVQYRTELEQGIIADLQKRILFLEECLNQRRYT